MGKKKPAKLTNGPAWAPSEVRPGPTLLECAGHTREKLNTKHKTLALPQSPSKHTPKHYTTALGNRLTRENIGQVIPATSSAQLWIFPFSALPASRLNAKLAMNTSSLNIASKQSLVWKISVSRQGSPGRRQYPTISEFQCVVNVCFYSHRHWPIFSCVVLVLILRHLAGVFRNVFLDCADFFKPHRLPLELMSATQHFTNPKKNDIITQGTDQQPL